MSKYLKIFFLILTSVSCLSQDFTELAEDIPESTILVVDGGIDLLDQDLYAQNQIILLQTIM